MMRHLNPRAIERARARDLVAIKSQIAEMDDQLGTVERDVDRLNEIDPDELADREYVIDVRYDLEDKIDAVKNTVSTLSEGPPPDRAADPDRVADVERQLSDLREDLSQSRAEVGAHDSLLDDIADWMRTHNFLS